MSYLGTDYYDCNKNDELMLDPRLAEYVKKRQYYKEHDLETKFLQKKYSITEDDMRKIKAYKKGHKKVYQDVHKDLIDPSEAKFPSNDFEKDKRLERIKAKQQRETDANNQRHDFGVISKSYDMYRKDRPFASASGNDFAKSSFHPMEWLASSNDEVRNYDDNVRPSESLGGTNTYVNPKSKYNSYISNDTTVNNGNDNTLDSIIGQLDSYKNTADGTNYRNMMFDDDNERNMPNEKYNGLRDNEAEYNAVPFMGSNNGFDRDIGVDTYMKFGTTPFRSGKSLGYPSTIEHSFNYISPDIQDPNHVVSERGIPSRGFNKMRNKRNI
jgi:hypothetical protein